MAAQGEDVVHEGPSYRQSQYRNDDAALIPDYIANDDDNLSLDFGSPQEDEDMMYDESRKLLLGDFNYPVIGVSSEAARKLMWDEEERMLRRTGGRVGLERRPGYRCVLRYQRVWCDGY